MGHGQHPACLPRFYPCAAGAVNPPAPGLDPAPSQALQSTEIETFQCLRWHTQDQRIPQLQPNPTAIALDPLDPPLDQGETAATQLSGRLDRRASPETDARLPRQPLGRLLALDQ